MNSLCANIGFLVLGAVMFMVATFSTSRTSASAPTCCLDDPTNPYRLTCDCPLSHYGIRYYQLIGLFCLLTPLLMAQYRVCCNVPARRSTHRKSLEYDKRLLPVIVSIIIWVIPTLLLMGVLIYRERFSFVVASSSDDGAAPAAASASTESAAWFGSARLITLAVLHVIAIGAAAQNAVGDLIAYFMESANGFDSEMC